MNFKEQCFIMKIEKGIISSSQLMYMIIGFIQGGSLTLAFVSDITKQNTWIVVITSCILIIPMALIYTNLANKFPGKNLVEINDIIYGRYFGKCISLFYSALFLLLITLNITFVSDALVNYLFPGTPIIVFYIIFTVLCAYAVHCGIEVIGRCAPILVIVSYIITIITIIMLFKEMDLHNFLPIFNLNLKQFINGNHVFISKPFDISVFLMIYSTVNEEKKIKKSTIRGVIIGTAFILLTAIRSTAVLGNLESTRVSPSYDVVGIIDIAQVFTRLEAFIIIIILLSLFIKTAIFYYATVLSIAQIFNLHSYKPLIMCIGIICINLSVFIFSSPSEHNYNAANIYPVFIIPFQILIPLLSLILTHFRKLSQE